MSEGRDQDLKSFLGHARNLEGRSLAEIAKQMGREELLSLPGKGAAGQLLQPWFGIRHDDNRDEPDIVLMDPEHGQIEIEIKAVPLAAKKRAGYRVKERCKVTSIDYQKLLAETWDDSRAKHKLNAVLFIYYDYAGKDRWQSSTVKKTVLWYLAKSSSKSVVQADWMRTWTAVYDGKAHLISEGDAAILGASTAGAGGKDKEVVQPNNPDAPARRRAFSLKPAFLKTTFEAECNPEKFESIVTLTGRTIPANFQDEVLKNLRPFAGLKLSEVAEKLGFELGAGKSAAATLLRRCFGATGTKHRLREIEELGIKIKTVPVRESDGWPYEAMSFPRVVLGELIEEEWVESELLAQLECLLILPILAPDRDTPKAERRLAPPFFWQPSVQEWEGIESEWSLFQTEVKKGKADATIAHDGGKTVRTTGLTPGRKTEFIHMRPHSRNGSDFDRSLIGTNAPVLCFWINQSFMQRVLRRELGKLGVHFPHS